MGDIVCLRGEQVAATQSILARVKEVHPGSTGKGSAFRDLHNTLCFTVHYTKEYTGLRYERVQAVLESRQTAWAAPFPSLCFPIRY